MRTGIIYIATSPNNKSYIGQTIKDLVWRITKHYEDSINHTYHFANALRKYKKEDWRWKILYNDIPKNQLGNMERWCIANYDTYNNGYNSTLGGEDNPMNYEENRKKVGDSKRGKKRPDMAILMKKMSKGRVKSKDEKLKISERTAGEKNPMFGKRHTDEIRLKMSLKRDLNLLMYIKTMC